MGQGHFLTSHLGDNMASVIWATKVSTEWVDQIDHLTDIFKEISIRVGGNRSKERDRKSELVIMSTYQNF